MTAIPCKPAFRCWEGQFIGSCSQVIHKQVFPVISGEFPSFNGPQSAPSCVGCEQRDASHRRISRLFRANPQYGLDRTDENLPIADLASLRRTHDGLDRVLGIGVGHDDFELQLRQKVHRVFAAAVDLRVPFCRPKPLTSTTVMPSTPMPVRASFTSSNLKGLMMASIFFIRCSEERY